MTTIKIDNVDYDTNTLSSEARMTSSNTLKFN